MYPNLVDNYAPAVQAELRKSLLQCKQQKAQTLDSFKSGYGARGEAGRLTGLEIPVKQGVPHGETALDTLRGVTSFENFVPPPAAKMYVGLAQTGATVEWEYFHEKDANAGYLPETKEDQRDQVMRTYYQHHNWYNIGVKYGTLAVITVGGGSGTITLANDNTARGRSKGSLRLAVSTNTTAGKRVLYQSYTVSTDTLTATFYITSKASVTSAVIVVTDGGTTVAGDIIVKKGHYKRVPYGMGYFFDNTSRQMQGLNTATFPEFNARRVNGGGGLINPTLMDAAVGAAQTRANDVKAGMRKVAHMTPGNYKVLGAFGYNLRVYNAEKGDANTTHGLPQNFKSEDLDFVLDADFEEAYIYIRNRKSFFLYRQAEMAKINNAETYVGTNLVGSTEKYDNYGESYNLAYDARGEDGMNKDGAGMPFDGVYVDQLEIPSNNQIAEGVSLV